MFNLRLIDNWKAVLTRAWSVWLIGAAAILSGLEIVLPMFEMSLPFERGTIAAISGVITGLAFIARLVAQKSISGE